MEEIKSKLVIFNDNGIVRIVPQLLDGQLSAVRKIPYGEEVILQPGERAEFYHRPDCAYFTNE